MRLLCIKDKIDKGNPSYPGHNPQSRYPLIIGRYYEGSIVFYNERDDLKNYTDPVEWEKNMLNIKGFSEIDYFPTSLFMTVDQVREHKLNEIGI